MAKEKYSPGGSWGPFDDSASERLRRMGLLTTEGVPDQNTLAVAAQLYAGLFFDALCDFHSDMERVNAACRELIERAGSEDPWLPFLAICSAYDAIYIALPEPVWWMAGHLELVTRFAAEFIKRLAEFTEESGVM